jgi:hypothetical protein
MSDSLRDGETAQSAADRFTDMGRKIAHNDRNGFGGAVVAFPPGGAPIELMMLNNSGDEALFWGTLKSLVEIRLREIAEQQSNNRPGWR